MSSSPLRSLRLTSLALANWCWSNQALAYPDPPVAPASELNGCPDPGDTKNAWVTNAGYGHFFTIWPEEESGGCGPGTYPFTRIQRRDWTFFAWDPWDCTGSSPSVCCADLGSGVTIDAITVPHYVVEP